MDRIPGGVTFIEERGGGLCFAAMCCAQKIMYLDSNKIIL